MDTLWNEYASKLGADSDVSQKYWLVIQNKYSEPQR